MNIMKKSILLALCSVMVSGPAIAQNSFGQQVTPRGVGSAIATTRPFGSSSIISGLGGQTLATTRPFGGGTAIQGSGGRVLAISRPFGTGSTISGPDGRSLATTRQLGN